MADQYGRDTSALAGAGGASPYNDITTADLMRRMAELQGHTFDNRQASQIDAVAAQYPEMGSDLQMMMQGAQNDISGASIHPDMGGAGQPGTEQMLQQVLQKYMQPEEQPNIFQRILQTASVMPGLTNDPAGAGILSLLMGATGTPLGTRAGGRGAELAGIGRLFSAYAQMQKAGIAQENQQISRDALRQFQANEAAAPPELKFGAHHMSPGVSYAIPGTGITIKAPEFGPDQQFTTEVERKTIERNRSRGTAGAPRGVAVGTGPSPIYDADHLGRASATGQPMPGPTGELPGDDPVETMRRIQAMAAGMADDKAAATALGTARGKGQAQALGLAELPPAQLGRIQQIDQGISMLDLLEQMYVGDGKSPPPVPGIEADPNDPASGAKIILQGLTNMKQQAQGDPNVEAPEKLRLGLAQLIAGDYGSKGNPSDRDVQYALGLIPSMWEGMGTRRQKLAALRQLQTRARESVLALQGRIPGVPGGGRDLRNPTMRRGKIEAVP